MFGKKKPVRIELKMEQGYYRLMIDYFDSKDKGQVRKTIYDYIGEVFPESLVQADSNFINKQLDGKDEEWMKKLIAWAETESLESEDFRFKREIAAGIFGGLMGKKVVRPGYRVGIVVGKDQFDSVVKLHGEIGMGVHMGCGLMPAERSALLKDYCGGRIDEFNFERYYQVDFYDYDLISRCVLKSLTTECLEEAKQELEKRLPCSNCR